MSNVESLEARVDVEEVVRIDVDEVERQNTADVNANANEVEEEDPMKRRTKKRKSQMQ